MQIIRVALLLFLFGAAAPVLPAAESANWLSDFQRAQTEAKASKKLLLLNFTGSDWCVWCMKLEREVFSQPEFQEYARNNLVLMKVDFPRGKSISATTRKQNGELAEKYQITGFPTIVVLNGDGKQVGELGYMPGGASAFVSELKKLPKS